MRGLILCCLIGAYLLPGSLLARDMDELPLVGEATYRYTFFKVYKARLFAPEGKYRHFERFPFVLTLTYQRDFKAGAIVDETSDQLQEVGHDNADERRAWLERLEGLLPEVSKGGPHQPERR